MNQINEKIYTIAEELWTNLFQEMIKFFE